MFEIRDRGYWLMVETPYLTCIEIMVSALARLYTGMDPGFQAVGTGDKQIFFFSNMHPYSINKLSTKTNTQK